MTHICVSILTIIGSDNGLSPGRRQAIIWTNAGILLTGPLGANFSEIFIGIITFSFKKMRFKVSSAKWRPFCRGLNGWTKPAQFTAWISNYIHIIPWDVIIQLCATFEGSLALQPLNLGQGWVITSHISQWMWLLIHAAISAPGGTDGSFPSALVQWSQRE